MFEEYQELTAILQKTAPQGETVSHEDAYNFAQLARKLVELGKKYNIKPKEKVKIKSKKQVKTV